jgi:small subunit ribosomal protein S2
MEETTTSVTQETTPLTPETIEIKHLLDAGVHLGHQTKLWNPMMKPYIFDKRNGIHIIDISKTLLLLKRALNFITQSVAEGRKILFVGTKKQAQQTIKEAALSCGQFYVTERWIGGTLTNAQTVRSSVKRLAELEEMEKNGEFEKMSKKQASRFKHELARLRRNLSGIVNMTELPGALFVVDTNKDMTAVKEANKIGIPVVAIVDTNCDPTMVDYVIPGNDDAVRSIKFIVDLVVSAIKKGAAEYEKLAAREIIEAEEKPSEVKVEVKKEEEEKKTKRAEKPSRKARPGTTPGRRGRPPAGQSPRPRKTHRKTEKSHTETQTQTAKTESTPQ